MARLDTGWHANPKVLGVGLRAMGLHAWSISYCDSTLSDGFVPRGSWPALSGVRGAVRTLISAGLWEEIDGGYRLHDYLDYNRSRDQVDAEREQKHDARARAGRAGGIASGASRRAKQPKQPPSKTEANDEAKGQAKPKQNEAPFPFPLTSSSLSELNPAGLAGWLPAPAHAPAREADPKLLAEHLELLAKERAGRQASQPIQNSSQETNGA